MNITEALKIRTDFYDQQMPSEDEIFAYTEAMGFLIGETKDPGYMMELGGWYYEEKRFDLALKYYEMAAECGHPAADVCLGYIWYYGRTGRQDFEKAFHYYSRSMEAGNLQAAYKVADMHLNDPLPEIYTRLARIRMEQERYEEAGELLVAAKEFLAERIAVNPFFGDLNIMKWLEEDLYRLPEKPDPAEMDLYDLYEVLKKPALVRFRYGKETYEVRSVMEDGACVIRFAGKWYRSSDDFFAKAKLSGRLLTGIGRELYGWEVDEPGNR